VQSALASFVRGVDAANEWIGRGVAWLVAAMVAITFFVVVLRYAFSSGWVWMQESYVWLHGVVFMMAAGYTLLHDGHVRVDIFYRPASARFKAWVDIGGALLLLLPFAALIGIESFGYVIESWSKQEASREAGGLPGLFLLKTVIWVFCALVALQGLSLAARSALVLFGHPEFAAKRESRDGV
jgi:TRAP-type mannitol/chloroaromatic compound transport system permease small subunit